MLIILVSFTCYACILQIELISKHFSLEQSQNRIEEICKKNHIFMDVFKGILLLYIKFFSN